jgi:hypothetical protein
MSSPCFRDTPACLDLAILLRQPHRRTRLAKGPRIQSLSPLDLKAKSLTFARSFGWFAAPALCRSIFTMDCGR